jgi:hypothetical protein
VAYAIGTALPVGAAVKLTTALFRGRPDQAGEADRRFTEAGRPRSRWSPATWA